MFTTGSLEGEKASFMAKMTTTKAVAAISNHSTRAKKIFTITEKGNLLFEELLEDPVSRDDPRGFNLRLGFAKHLSPAARIRMLERRRLQLIDRFEVSKKNLAQPHRILDEYELAIAKHSLEIVALDLAWVESLLEQENLRVSAMQRQTDKNDLSKDTPTLENNVSLVGKPPETFSHPQVETPV
jgi:DNA-binding PadR family transcriptional regulator